MQLLRRNAKAIRTQTAKANADDTAHRHKHARACVDATAQVRRAGQDTNQQASKQGERGREKVGKWG